MAAAQEELQTLQSAVAELQRQARDIQAAVQHSQAQNTSVHREIAEQEVSFARLSFIIWLSRCLACRIAGCGRCVRRQSWSRATVKRAAPRLRPQRRRTSDSAISKISPRRHAQATLHFVSDDACRWPSALTGRSTTTLTSCPRSRCSTIVPVSSCLHLQHRRPVEAHQSSRFASHGTAVAPFQMVVAQSEASSVRRSVPASRASAAYVMHF